MSQRTVLSPGDPPPFRVVRPGAGARLVLVGDHAGNLVPAALEELGLTHDERTRHIAWDLGVHALGTYLATQLDASFVHQTYSRLVIDCNREPDAEDAIAETSDGTTIPGNARLGSEARRARRTEIFEPYQAAVAGALARTRVAYAPAPPVLVSLHSFTPQLRGGSPRPWNLGVLHDGGDTRFAHACRRAFEEVLAADGLDPKTVGDNAPYVMDGTDYTVPHHAYEARLPYVELELRQDLLATPEGIVTWGGRIQRALDASLRRLG